MESAADFRRLSLGLLAVLSTALLVWFGTGLHPFWPLMWLAPLPVLIFVRRASWWSAALAAILAWFLGILNLWHYFHEALQLPPFLLARIFGTLALVFALAVLLHRALLRRGAYWSALLAFPALWVSFEYLLNLTSPHATAGNLAYTQLEFLPFLQLASLTGPWGMSFLLLSFSSAIAIGLHLRARAPKQALRIVGTSLGVIALVLVFGAARLALPAHGTARHAGHQPAAGELQDRHAAGPGGVLERRPEGDPSRRLPAVTSECLVAGQEWGRKLSNQILARAKQKGYQPRS